MQRRRRHLCTLAGVLGIVLAGPTTGLAAGMQLAGPSSWTTYDMTQTHDAVYHPLAAGVSWATNVPGGIVGGLTVVGSTVYGGGLDGTVFALDERSGRMLWEHKLPNSVFNPPTYVNGRLYVGIGNDIFVSRSGDRWIRGTPPNGLYALSARTGRVLWKVATIGNDKTPPVYYDGLLYSADGHGGLRAINPISGRVLWRVNDGGISNDSPPVIKNGVIYLNTLGPSPGGLRAFSARDGHQLWSYIGTNADNAVTLGGDTLLAVNSITHFVHGRSFIQNEMVAVSLQGHKLWSFTTKAGPAPPAFEAPAATYHNGVFYDGSTVRKDLYAIDAVNGRLLWRTRLKGFAYGNPTVSHGYVFADTTSGYLETLDAATGRVLMTRKLPGNLGASEPILIGGTIFIGGVLGSPAQIVRGIPVPGKVWAIPVRQLLPIGDSLSQGPPPLVPVIGWPILIAVALASCGVLWGRWRRSTVRA